MTLDEFSNEFDILAQSYLREGGFTMSDSSLFAFNEYEKSVYLTREQEGLVIALYSGNGSYGGFEVTEQVRRDLDNLLCEVVLDPKTVNAPHIVSNSQFFELPDGKNNPKLWYIVYEAASYDSSAEDVDTCFKDKPGFPVEVVPVPYDDFHRIKGNPFRGPKDRRALRLDKGNIRNANLVEIVPKQTLGKYYVKYIRRPDPIILVDLGNGLAINGVSKKSNCPLHETLHRMILDMAVRTALNSRALPTKQSGES